MNAVDNFVRRDHSTATAWYTRMNTTSAGCAITCKLSANHLLANVFSSHFMYYFRCRLRSMAKLKYHMRWHLNHEMCKLNSILLFERNKIVHYYLSLRLRWFVFVSSYLSNYFHRRSFVDMWAVWKIISNENDTFRSYENGALKWTAIQMWNLRTWVSQFSVVCLFIQSHFHFACIVFSTRRFKTEQLLASHIKTHKSFEFKCSQCDKMFRKKGECLLTISN